jgi:phage tail protein X
MSSTAYTTQSGDTWDAVALSVYGNVTYAEYLMSQNQDADLLATVIFDSGVLLNTPALPQPVQVAANQPPWRS